MPRTASSPKKAASSGAPNLLVALADQLRPHSTGLEPAAPLRTPNLERLAAEGVNFVNAVSNTPLCGPFRACMLTGRYPHANGVIANWQRLPENQPTLGQILRHRGYQTAWVGKWHLGGERMDHEPPGPGRHGFDFWSGYEFHHRHNDNRYWEDDPEPLTTDGYQADHETQRAIEFIERRDPRRPFCLFVSWGPPHPPYAEWNVPPRYLAPFAKRLEPLDPCDAGDRWKEWQEPFRLVPRKLTPARPNAFGERVSDRDVACYYAMTLWVDDCLGRLLGALDELGLRDETIVVFASDHGEMLGSHGMRGKMIFYDESVRIPLVIRWPGQVPDGLVSDVCISAVDILPTLLGLLGIEAPPGLQGMDLSPHALGRNGPQPPGAFLASYAGYEDFHLGWEYRGVRTKRYTYVRSLFELLRDYAPQPGRAYSRTPEVFLFDNLEDPYQQHNLAGDPTHAAVLAGLEALLGGHLRATGDSFRPATDYAPCYRRGRRIRPLP